MDSALPTASPSTFTSARMLLPLLAAAALSADTLRYTVVNHGRPAGEMVVVRRPDSTIVRYRHVDRNRGQRHELRYRIGPDGAVIGGELRSVGLDDGRVGEPTDRFEIVADSVRWGITGITRAASRDSGFYRIGSGPVYESWRLARHLLARPGHEARLLPGGTARLEIVGDTTVRTSRGRERVRLVMLHSPPSATPRGLWLDDRGELFASEVHWFITVREGAEAALPALRKKELAYHDARGATLARRLMPAPVPAVAIVGADLFDAVNAVVVPRRTILIRGDRIVAVGPVDSIQVPADAQRIDASGRTVIPGLWEMHGHMMHTSQATSAIQQLARGITTTRDLASDVDVAVAHRDRTARGEILGPTVILGGFIEGPGAWAGPSDALVRTEAEARAWVARYDSLGYRQVKLYNLVHPDLVPAIADETKRRGLRLSGHVPRGLSTPAAVRLGFDEINHAAFLFSTFFPDSLFTPAMRPYSAVAQLVAPHVDVDGPAMTAMIDLFRERGTVIDGTFNLWMTGGVGAGQQPAGDVARGRENWSRLIRRLHDAGVTLVPGTDAFGSGTYVTELELYERAGIPAPRVLQLATLGSARVMGLDGESGSVTPGKVADLVIINGRPAERVADLRNVEQVVRAGRVYDPRALLAEIGFTARGRAPAQRRATPNRP